MPLITVNLIENVFSAQEKANLITKLTDTMVEIEGEAMRSVTWVKIEEIPEGQWGIAGNAMTCLVQCPPSQRTGAGMGARWSAVGQRDAGLAD